MDMKKRLGLACLLIFMIPTAGIHAGNETDVQKAITAAKAAQKKADDLQGGWVSTDALIKQAEKAAAKGDNKTAMELASKARREAELAHAQAEYERQHWSPPPYAQP
jgi:hypothetical protein